ncbi:MAG: PAS domain S-box protein [Magnetospirillum sp.]|nr:PAS domain S-box protein [Magnetospirillum sp.]
MLVCVWLGGGFLAWRDRADTLRDSGFLAEAVTRVVAERLNGSLRGIDLLLQDVSGRFREKTVDASTLVAVMRYRSAAFGEVRNVFIIGADGVVKTSTLAAMVGVNLSGRPYFQQAAKSVTRPALIISPPDVSPVTGRSGIVVARSIISPLGTFDGVVAAALNPEFFIETLSGVVVGNIDRAVIANRDGDVMARLPDPGRHVGASIRSGPLFVDHLPKAKSGVFIAPSTFDGLERQAAYVSLDNYPLVASVGITTSAALRRWTVNALIMGGGGVIFTALILVAALQSERRERKRLQAEAELKASEESYRILVDNQDDLIHRYLPDTTLVSFNQAYARFYAEKAETLLGRRWIEFIPEEERAFVRSCLMALTRAEPYREDRRRVIRPDGSERWIEWRTQALHDGLGNLTGYQTTGRDVTDAQRAQQAISEREELYSQSFHRNPAIKLLIDPANGAVVDANDSAALFYGYPIDVLKRLRITDINTAQPEEVAAEMRAVENEGRKFLRFKHRMASGEIRDVEVYASPLHVGGRSYLSSIVVDVTDRNRFEAELQAKTAELERSNSELEQFAYVASHDLRQPLRMISSYVTLLGRSLGDRLGESEREFIDFAVSGVKRMDALILGLLEYSRVGRGGEALEVVGLDDLVDAACANLGVGTDASDAVVKVERPLPQVSGVPSELLRLFQNLIGNAIKYRHPNRSPVIRIGAKREDASWQIAVEDNGMGIEAEHFERIFKMFQRLHGETEYEGTGIGLAICRKIVANHGGRLWVESEPGQGCRFLISLPVVAA